MTKESNEMKREEKKNTIEKSKISFEFSRSLEDFEMCKLVD